MIMESKGEKSVIDLVTVRGTEKKRIISTRIRRGFIIGSNHCLIVTKVKVPKSAQQQTGNHNMNEDRGQA